MNDNYVRTVMGIFEELVKPPAQSVDPVVAYEKLVDDVPVILCWECHKYLNNKQQRKKWSPVTRTEALNSGIRDMDCDCCYDPIVVA